MNSSWFALIPAAAAISVGLFTSLPAVAQSSCPAALNFSATPLIGEKAESLCQHQGKVVLIVNTASACGYTPQYDGLEKLYGQYKSKGVVVLGFPANDFGSQERGSNGDIANFCKVNYGVTFPMYQKLNQPITADPMFVHLKKASGSTPGWNFHKYLIDKQGKVQGFSSDVEPQSAPLRAAIDEALKQ